MPNTKKIMLEKFGISKARYDELLGFCRQYEEKKTRLNELYDLSSAPADAPVSGGLPGKSTENKALRAIHYREDLEKIDSCLDLAAVGYGVWMRTALFESICRGKKFSQLDIYGKPVLFYRARIKFFRALDTEVE